MIWDVIRVVAYAAQSLILVYLAIDDYERGRKSDIVWAALAIQSMSVLALLSLDIGSVIVWIEARYILTLPATVATIVIGWFAGRRLMEQLPRSNDDERNTP